MNRKQFGTVHTVRAHQLIKLVGDRGFDSRDLARRAGLGAAKVDPTKEKMPLDRIISLFEDAAAITGNDLLGFQFGQSRDPRDMGLVGYVGVVSPSVLALFENTLRYQRILGTGMLFDASRLRPDAVFQWSGEPKAQQYWEYNAANCINQLRNVTGVLIEPVCVGFSHDRARNRSAVADYFGCPVHWSEDRNFIQFKREDLARKLKTADDRLLGVLHEHAEQALAEFLKGSSEELAEIRHALTQQMSQGRPTSEAVAGALGLSNRTLSRRLSEAGTDFRSMLDETREALAREYIASGEFSFAEITYLLGFADPSSFSAACRRWTNMTPSELQKSLLETL